MTCVHGNVTCQTRRTSVPFYSVYFLFSCILSVFTSCMIVLFVARRLLESLVFSLESYICSRHDPMALDSCGGRAALLRRRPSTCCSFCSLLFLSVFSLRLCRAPTGRLRPLLRLISSCPRRGSKSSMQTLRYENDNLCSLPYFIYKYLRRDDPIKHR